MPEIEEFLKKLGPIWSPVTDPPELGTVPLDAGRMSPDELSGWLGKCTAWLTYAQSQLGLAEAQKTLVQRRFSRMANELVVTKKVKQRTYELQVAEVAIEREDLIRLQEEIGELEAKVVLWTRMTKAYEAYTKLFFEERDTRKWHKD